MGRTAAGVCLDLNTAAVVHYFRLCPTRKSDVTIEFNEKRKKKSDKVNGAKRSQSTPAVNPGRHEFKCTICSHANCEEIEQAFVSWVSRARIAHDHSVTRDSIYRHARAVNLMEKRRAQRACGSGTNH
jgi:hypothetical protein